MSLEVDLTNELQEVEFRAGETLFHENDPGFHFYVIQEGQVEVFRSDRNNSKIPLGLIGPGEAVGELARFNREPRSATARAVTPVRAVKVSEDAYEELVDNLPGWALAMIEQLVKRLRQTNDILRRYGIVDEKLMMELEKFESDPEANTQWLNLYDKKVEN